MLLWNPIYGDVHFSKFDLHKLASGINGVLYSDKPLCVSFPFFACEFMREEKRTKAKYRVDIYIGSDNYSRKIHNSYLHKVRKWANATFPDGYTLVRGEGYYNDSSEDSILLHAFLNYDVALKHRLKKLKKELKQESILFVKSPADFELV